MSILELNVSMRTTNGDRFSRTHDSSPPRRLCRKLCVFNASTTTSTVALRALRMVLALAPATWKIFSLGWRQGTDRRSSETERRNEAGSHQSGSASPSQLGIGSSLSDHSDRAAVFPRCLRSYSASCSKLQVSGMCKIQEAWRCCTAPQSMPS